jgi:hypothetical protein
VQLSRFFNKKVSLKFFFYTGCLLLLVLVSKPHVCKKNTPITRQGEAKIQLKELHYIQSELHYIYGTYATCIEDAGYKKSRAGHYIIGFSKTDQASTDVIKSKGIKCNSPSYVIPTEWYNKFDTKFIPQTEVSKNKFTAFAIGKVAYDPDYPLDIWTIDQDGKLVHVQDGSRSTSLKKRLSDWYNN